ncbi:hypothetical protein LX59_00935 [Azomonas agilis]|uniref:Uncharacterized protein n=1 Tax=Azomonas agilis TaxID=116849 RepID=A0A562J1A6_9GAMM|nr:hypothetical protein [Azomonas agilis]TWH76890.1 hypothetical protein LX59_00935 [Azomonas agilis]
MTKSEMREVAYPHPGEVLLMGSMSEDFWTGLQADYDREMTKDALVEVLAKIKPWSPPQMDQTSPL